jgi:hypothetical protein
MQYTTTVTPPTKVIFLDMDGVIRLPPEGDWIQQPPSEYCQARMKLLAKVCLQTGAQIVVSSDWRLMENFNAISSHLQPHLTHHLHPDWRTPTTGKRWNEVEAWLVTHQEVSHYAILEDFEPHFESCPTNMKARIVWCNNRHGLVPQHVDRLIQLLQP